MNTADSSTIFIPEFLDCPACGLRSRHWLLNPQLYEVSGYGIDLKPLITWKRRIHAKYNPENYYILHCPVCFFSGDPHFFRDPLRDTSISRKVFHKKAMNLVFQDPDCCRIITALKDKTPDIHAFGYPDAIKRYLSAIFFLGHFKSIVDKDAIPLARCHLHYSWLLRDIHKSGAREDCLRLLEELQNKFAGMWDHFSPDPADAARHALHFYETAYHVSSRLAASGSGLKTLQLIGRIELYLNNFRNAQHAFFKCIKLAHAEISILKQQQICDPVRDAISRMQDFAEESRSLLKNASPKHN